jgi:hypothetical protein
VGSEQLPSVGVGVGLDAMALVGAGCGTSEVLAYIAAFLDHCFWKDHAVRAFRDVAWDTNGIVKVWISATLSMGITLIARGYFFCLVTINFSSFCFFYYALNSSLATITFMCISLALQHYVTTTTLH